MAYTPAGLLTSSATLGHLQAVLYKRKGLDILQKKFVFRECVMKDTLAKNSGKTAQWYRYQNLGTNTTPATEGTVGTPLTLTTNVLQATVSQYVAFITVSDMLRDTAIDPAIQSASERLGYQAGLSVDTMTRNVIDAQSASTNQSLFSTYLRVADVRAAVHNLQALDVQPYEDNEFKVVAHPFATYDLVNDPAAGGYADIYKYTSPKDSQLVRREDRGLVGHVAGAKIIESTNVKTQSGPNRYRVYIFGNEGVGALDLEGKGPSDVKDPRTQRFAINVIKGEPSIADPAGVIGGAVSYNFAFCSVVLEGPAGIGGTYRYKTLDPQSTLG